MERAEWDRYLPESFIESAQEIFTAPSPRSLKRIRMFWTSGMFRVARRDCSLYSVEVANCGAWGRLRIFTGTGRIVFDMPSLFTGSFPLEGFCEGGLICHIACGPGSDILMSVTFTEPDTDQVLPDGSIVRSEK